MFAAKDPLWVPDRRRNLHLYENKKNVKNYVCSLWKHIKNDLE